MATEDQKLAIDVFAWFLNVSTSVLIVFVNKILMDRKLGYGFVFATTLCAFHFLACAGSIWVAQWTGFAQKAKVPLPWGETLQFAMMANVSIASLNLSLLVNSVGFYQIAKLLIIPFVCLVELLWLKRTFTFPVVCSVGLVVAGVAVVTVTDVTVNTMGLVIAGISVISSGMQQIMCGLLQRKYTLSSHQLLSSTAPVQGIILLFVGPFMDKLVSDAWIFNYEYSVPSLMYLFVSCSVAVLVNISQFMCLGRFTAVSFQVLGHAKTITVLMVGYLYFKDTMSSRKVLGMGLAVVGMVMYGYFSSQQRSVAATTKKDELEQPLLPKNSDSHSDLSKASTPESGRQSK